jgi:hypothetical protein
MKAILKIKGVGELEPVLFDVNQTFTSEERARQTKVLCR